MDPEALRGVLARSFERMKSSSTVCSVEKFIGDAVGWSRDGRSAALTVLGFAGVCNQGTARCETVLRRIVRLPEREVKTDGTSGTRPHGSDRRLGSGREAAKTLCGNLRSGTLSGSAKIFRRRATMGETATLEKR